MSTLWQDRRMVLAAACCLLAASVIPDLCAADRKVSCKTGVDKNFPWQRIDINAARKLGKPILLYVYDPKDGKPNEGVRQIQLEILANPDVKQDFAGFTPVMQSVSATNWPPTHIALAKNGAALLIMTCDANPVAVFTHPNLPKASKEQGGKKEEYPLLHAAAAAALQANPKALEAMRNNPPKEYLSPEQLAAQREVAAQPPEAEAKADAVAGLLDKTVKSAAKPADAVKKAPAKAGNEVE